MGDRRENEDRAVVMGGKVVGSAGTVVIDAFGDTSPVEQWMGKPTNPHREWGDLQAFLIGAFHDYEEGTHGEADGR